MFSLFITNSIAQEVQISVDVLPRMHNKTGWVGTKTNWNDYSGFVSYLTTKEEVTNHLKNVKRSPEFIVLPFSLANDEIFNQIQKEFHPIQYFQGILVLSPESNLTYDISHHYKSPNSKYSFDKSNYEWNPTGKEMFTFKYDWPIVILPNVSSNYLKSIINFYGSRAGFYLNSFMYSRKDSAQCLKDGTCDPIGGLSVYGSYNSLFTKDSTKKDIWAIASMDTRSLFPYASVGADYSVSGFVALLSALEALKNLDWTKATKNLNFAFFEAEETGYIGSERFLTDIESFKCKDAEGNYCKTPYRPYLEFQDISLNNIESIFEIKSIGLLETENTLYAHTSQSDSSKTFVENLRTTLNGKLGDISISFPDSSVNTLPPSSMHSFLKRKPQIPHTVLTGFNKKFFNKNIGSESDIHYDINNVIKSSIATARILANLAGFPVEDYQNLDVNHKIVSELMKIFVLTANESELMHELFPNSRIPSDHSSIYSGVYKGYSQNMKQLVITHLLGDAIASARKEITNTQCTHDNNCTNLGRFYGCSDRNFSQGSEPSHMCERKVIRTHAAYSPSFEYENEKWIIKNNDEKYPFDTEASWKNIDARIVLLPSFYLGRIIIGIAIIWLILFTYFGSSLWFKNLSFLEK